jgi:energy-coupling factor transporter ATP-binding protein EcfA2
MMKFPPIRIKFGTMRVDILCDSAPLYELMMRHLYYCLCPESINTSPSTVFRIESAGDSYTLLRDDQPLYRNIASDTLPVILMNDVITGLIAPCADAMIFHAAGLALNDKGIVLCGASGSGKSTLTALLIQRGFDYLSDEVIAVSPVVSSDNPHSSDTPTMIGLSRSVALKAGSDFIWRGTPLPHIALFADGSAWLPPDSIRADCVREQAALNVVVFPRYDARIPFEAVSLSKAQITFKLMAQFVNARNLPHDSLSTITRMVAQVEGYSLVYNDVEQVAQWLRR